MHVLEKYVCYKQFEPHVIFIIRTLTYTYVYTLKVYHSYILENDRTLVFEECLSISQNPHQFNLIMNQREFEKDSFFKIRFKQGLYLFIIHA